MSVGTFLYTLLIKPLQLIFEIIYNVAYENIQNPGLAIIALSLAMNFLVLPLYQRADAMQEQERETEAKLHKWVSHIKKTFRGDERTMMLQTYYRQNHYSPTYVLRGAMSLFLEIPFFIAAYNYLSNLDLLSEASFGPIADLSKPDALICIGSLTVNVLPILMTLINVISSAIFTKGYPLKTKIQLYAMAAFFLVFLYTSPSGLVFYWTLNNLFSLIKTIFYKLKNPRKVLSVMAFVAGCGCLVLAGYLLLNGYRGKVAVCALAGIALCLPLLFSMFKNHRKLTLHLPEREPNKWNFILSGLFLAVLTGVLIPSAVLKASPSEFLDVNYFVHPLNYVLHSFILAFGLFVLWFGVFYWLTSKKARPTFENVMWVIAGLAVVNYLFFGTDLGLISSDLIFDEGLFYYGKELLINAAILIGTAAILVFVFIKWQKIATRVLSVTLAAFICMSAVNCVEIDKEVSSIDLQLSEDAPHITLSKTGKNVIFIMLDRACGVYVPYLFNEKPELQEQFSGFTYYSNVVSFGPCTNFGSPAVYGGYEYTPVEINKRDTETLVSKQNEALKVLPVLFDENGYDVTVFDPTYANYKLTPDLSIYDEYEDIKAYNTKGYFSRTETKESQIQNRNRNFFCYGLMKIMPLLFQTTIYNNGQYNGGHTSGQITTSTQEITSSTTAIGDSANFLSSYNVLERLSDMTSVSDAEEGTFLMMSNDATHDVAMLQEPEYEPSTVVNNTQYEKENRDRFTVNGLTLNMEESVQYTHYQSNMAAMLKLGEWFDTLKEYGVYDNTKIIIASDHGTPREQLDELILDEGVSGIKDVCFFYPLLMVKDYNATEFTTSDEFMTNADVATIAVTDNIENPVNPFTGKEINNDEKTAHDQYIFTSQVWDVNKNGEYTFLPSGWFAVHDNMWDWDNWRVAAEDAVLPEEVLEDSGN